MATRIGRAELQRAQKAALSARKRAENLKAQAEDATDQLMTAATVGGTAFGFAYISHRFRGDDGSPGVEIMGIPLDLGSALAFHLFGFMSKKSSKYKDTFHNIANGALASYATIMGIGIGSRQYREQGGGGGGALGPGTAPAATQGLGLTARDMANLQNL